jgi:hypothetical protein
MAYRVEITVHAARDLDSPCYTTPFFRCKMELQTIPLHFNAAG